MFRPLDGNTCLSSWHLPFIVLFLRAVRFLAQSFLALEKLSLLKKAIAFSGAAAPHFSSDCSRFLCDITYLLPPFILG